MNPFKAIVLALALVVGSYLNADALTLAWDNTNAPGVVTGYSLYFNEKDQTDTPYVANISDEATTTITLSDALFKPGETYVFHVTAFNTKGESLPSNTIEYLVPMYEPPVENLPTITWTVPNKPEALQEL